MTRSWTVPHAVTHMDYLLQVANGILLENDSEQC